MPTNLEIIGSSPRDFCMLERNFLSHARLALLFVLFSSAVLLQIRLPLTSDNNPEEPMNGSVTYALASMATAAAACVIAAGYSEYELGFQDVRKLRPTYKSSKLHFVLMVLMVVTVFGACILLLLFGDQIGFPAQSLIPL
ncbi:hypothetical protein K488DRAFT_52057 [Vararia minispora EC-137]|uniref:Uncharacterized protein n=1 Tax=Vararia minispora EC-137 TaxID=1314806 RepID=A0ACB8QHW8_9AGAM|nr:hypothetical protein K488DRAFT_52057 [Vararia minispora EC-137]